MKTPVTKSDMKALDALAVSRFHYPIEQMMELAGFQLATFIAQKLDKKSRVLVACGSGNNGGGGFVAARHLVNWGFDTTVFLSGRRVYKKPPKQMLEILIASGCDITADTPNFDSYTTIVDCLIGYGLDGSLKPETKNIVGLINKSRAKVVALDVPSGLDVDSGEPVPVAVRADATLVLAAEKVGLAKKTALDFTGKQILVDIGIPRVAYRALNIFYPF